MYPERLGDVIDRIGQFYIDSTSAQIKATGCFLDGLVIWGEMAYKHSLLYDPDYCRKYIRPYIKKMIDNCDNNRLPVIYNER